MSAKLTLTVLKGPIRGQTFIFEEHDTFIFGRSQACHARLPDSDLTASRHHFILEANPPEACIRDLGSRNGTYVNDQRIGGRSATETPEEGSRRRFPEVWLRDGDEIRVGETVFLLEIAASCCDCARPIRDADKEACEWFAGTYVCADCRERARRANEPPPKLSPMLCMQCRREVAAEIGQGVRGAYICQSCREMTASDPAAVVRSLLRDPALAATAGLKAIADYEIGAMLGRGGMGAVYLARRKGDSADVALKVMLAKIAVDERSRAMFMREIETTRTLRHGNIVEFLDAGSLGSAFYCVLELCAGGSVADLMRRSYGSLELAEAAPIMMDALAGLAHAHKMEFVHRDLKPPNILLAGDGRRHTAKIADMGLAKNFAKAGLSGMTATGSYSGSYLFMPREQVTNFKFVKPSADVWSIGATFYNMLTGEVPRDVQRGQDPIEAILTTEALPIRTRKSQIPMGVAEVIDRALSNKVAERYPDATAMREALQKVL